MSDVLTALLLTHLVADFTLQTNWVAENKHDDWRAMGVHIATHAVVALVALGIVMQSVPFALLFTAAYALSHRMIDSIQPRPPINVDQSLHLVVIIALATVHYAVV